jgi:dTDP-3-amino-3,4,6-trideoxy-alpha-D-glucose transaminase
VHHLFPIRVPHRDVVVDCLRAAGVEVDVHYSPALSGQPALRGLARVPAEVPQAEAWAAEELSLPMSPTLRPSEVERAAEACLEAVGG